MIRQSIQVPSTHRILKAQPSGVTDSGVTAESAASRPGKTLTDGTGSGPDKQICWAPRDSPLATLVSSKLQEASCIYWADKSCFAPYVAGDGPSVYAFTLDSIDDKGMHFNGVFCPCGENLDKDPACGSLPALAGILTEFEDRSSALCRNYAAQPSASWTPERAVREDPARQAHPHLPSFTARDRLGFGVRGFLTQTLEERVPSHLREPGNVSRRTRFVYMVPSEFPDILDKDEFAFEPYYDRP